MFVEHKEKKETQGEDTSTHTRQKTQTQEGNTRRSEECRKQENLMGNMRKQGGTYPQKGGETIGHRFRTLGMRR